MQKRTLLLLLFSLTTCASSPEPEQESAPQAEECISQPELAQNWGECNVKKVIFDRSTQIQSCFKHVKKSNLPKQEVIMRIQLLPNGQVKTAKTEGSSIEPGLSNCLQKAFRNLRFASPPKGVNPTVYFPISPEMSSTIN